MRGCLMMMIEEGCETVHYDTLLAFEYITFLLLEGGFLKLDR